jgi:hypothetical protein
MFRADLAQRIRETFAPHAVREICERWLNTTAAHLAPGNTSTSADGGMGRGTRSL